MSFASWEEEHEALLRRAAVLPEGDEKVRLLEAAVLLADRHGDVGRAYRARLLLLSASVFGGQPEKALVAFAWCRAQSRKDPERFDERHLLWSNKWIILSLPSHLGVTREQILDAQEDFAEALSRHGGGGARAIAKIRLRLASSMGEMESTKIHFAAWRDTPRDWYSDCPACDLNTEVDTMVDWGRHDEAIERAVPLVTGKLSCAEVPQFTYPLVVMSAFWLGRLEEARGWFSRGYRLTRDNRKFLWAMGGFLAFLGLTGNHGPALTLLERHLGWAIEARAPLDALPFFVLARFVLSQIAGTGEREIALRLPRTFPLFLEHGLYDVHALHGWFDEQATTLSARFDARNGNAHYTSELDRSRRWGEHVQPFRVASGLG